MLTDRHGLNLTTTSAPARDAYDRGCDLMLGAYPGAPEAFAEALAAIGRKSEASTHYAEARRLNPALPAR